MIIVPDTNILLHYQLLDSIDLKKHVSRDVDLVAIPLVVIEELDRKKYSESASLAGRARAVLRFLETHEESGVEIRAGIALEIIDEEPDRVRRDSADHEIVRICLDLHSTRSESVTLLTDDYGMRIRARSLFRSTSNSVATLPESQLLKKSESRKDTPEILDRSAESGPAPVKSTPKKKEDVLRLSLEGSKTYTRPAPVRLRSQDDVVADIVRKEAGEFPEIEQAQQSGGGLGLGVLADHSKPSPESIDKFNDERESYLDAYESYAVELYNFIARGKVRVDLPLLLLNRADSAVEVIEVKLTLRDKTGDLEFVRTEDLDPDDMMPEAPTRPAKPRSTFEMASFIGSNQVTFPDYQPPMLYNAADWDVTQGGTHATSQVERIWPDGRPYSWDDGLAVTSRSGAPFVTGFSIEWELYASRPDLKVVGQLDVLPWVASE